MTVVNKARLQRLRGSLPREEIGARGIEHLGRNLACQLLWAGALAGVAMATFGTTVYGNPSIEGRSGFALKTGMTFEQTLVRQRGARLHSLYHSAGRLGPTARVVDVSRLAGKGPRAMQRRRSLTRRFLAMMLRGNPHAPQLIIKPRLRVTALGSSYDLELDYLVADGQGFYTVGEIKSYEDRDGKTSPSDIRNACRQAAVYVLALRQAAARLHRPHSTRTLPARVDLVLRKPGTMAPSLRSMSVAGEVDTLQRVLSQAPRVLVELEQLLQMIGPHAALDTPAVLDQIPIQYQEPCREFCALAPRCKQRALASGDPVVLGHRMQEALAAAGSIPRALELLLGRGAPPRTPEEQALQADLQHGHRALLRMRRARP